jgi:hypothetical protein
MFRAVEHNCARPYILAMMAMETRVDRKVDVVCLQEPPGDGVGRRLSHLAFNNRNRKRVWMALRKRSGYTINK